MTNTVQLVEVGPRDGFQSVAPFIETARKIEIISGLYAAGLRRMETTSFVSPAALPQMADAAEIVAAGKALPGLEAQVLIPTSRHAQRALNAGATSLAFVLSASERHNQSNVRRSPQESVADYSQVVAMTPPGLKLRLNLATAFDCPYGGPVDPTAVRLLLDQLIAIAPEAEIALCDTTGRVTPGDVGRMFDEVLMRFPTITWVFHAHDTFGMGAANVLAAWTSGVRIFDAAVAGLGGCPFAPGATGNVATEDLVWMFEGIGVSTGIDLEALVEVAGTVAELPGAQIGGRVRAAVTAHSCCRRSAT